MSASRGRTPIETRKQSLIYPSKKTKQSAVLLECYERQNENIKADDTQNSVNQNTAIQSKTIINCTQSSL